MTSKLEDVARAIHLALGWESAYGDSEYSKKISDTVARAALLATKKPTKKMFDAGYKAAAFPRDPEICAAMFNAMIDSILEEK